MKECRLKHFNIAFFASVMGFGGLALATHKLESVFDLGTHYSVYILYFTWLYFSVILISYLFKMLLNMKEIKEDFRHPVKSNFFPGVGKILIIFSIGFLTISHDIANYFWIAGVGLQSIFTVIIFRRWILHPMEIKAMNPLWFLPIVGNMLAAVSGVPLGHVELSQFFFSVGFFMWCVLFIIIMNRIIFHNPLPQKLMPTLFILIAPPAIGLIGTTVLNGGVITELGKMLYYFSLFMFIIIMSKINVLSKLKFFLSWWAYSFPMAALTIATILFYDKTGFCFMKYLSIIFYVILIVMIIGLFYRTIIGFQRRELCVEED